MTPRHGRGRQAAPLRRKLAAVFLVLFLGLFIFAAVRFFGEWSAAKHEAVTFETLSREAAVREAQAAASPEESADTDKLLPRYESLYARNPDLFGWVSIEGTKIDYPVMHTPEDEEYYLRRDFDGEDSNAGVPFLAGECFLGCGNYIVYGHHLFSGAMFSDLLRYEDEAFYEEHPTVRFDTLREKGEYAVLAAFEGEVYAAGEEGFRYYAYTDLTDPAVFEEYLAGVRERALYETGVTAEYGDELLTLSTCRTADTGRARFVVVAKKVSNAGDTP